MNVSDIFRYKKEHYKNNINPIKDYADIVSNVIKVMDKAISNPIESLRSYIKTNKLYKNPKVLFHERDLNGNRTKQTTDLHSYIKYVKQSGDIIVPSFTVYFSKKKKASLHAEFININVRERSKHKKLAFKYKMDGNFEKFNYHNVIQKVKKIFNNSLSGAYASMGTILNNASAHYTLTSITRVVSGIGNIISESYISGNRHYRDPDITFNHIATIAHSLDLKLVEEAVNEFNILIPTPDEVLFSVMKSTTKYWRDVEKENILLSYLTNLSDMQRVAILYHNDLFHLRMYNDELMRNMIKECIHFEIIDMDDEAIKTVIKEADEWLYTLSIYVNNEKLKGKKTDDFTRDDKLHIANFILSITKVFVKYESIYKAFIITDIFPTSLAYLKDMIRESIVLSDTDSTCATYENWIEWYFGKQIFTSESVAVASTIMTFVTVGTDHYIKAFSGNMNITYEASQVLAMKNEFFWDVFANTNVSKHYFANIVIQEGNVYDLPPEKTLEKKGVNLIAPNAYNPARKLSEKMMIAILKSIGSNKKVSLEDTIEDILQIEEEIYDKILKGSPDVLKMEKIKPAKSYKLDENHSPYVHHKLWEEVFSPKYKHAPDPQYMAVKLPTLIKTKGDMNRYLDGLEDKELANRFRKFLKTVGKDAIPTFRLPLMVVYSNGIPDVLRGIINYRQVIKDNTKHLSMMLESLGYFIKNESILIEELGDKDVNTIDD